MTCLPDIKFELSNKSAGFTLCSEIESSRSYRDFATISSQIVNGRPTLNINMPSASTWMQNRKVTIGAEYSNHGILRAGSPNRTTPSIPTHFINSHNDSVDEFVTRP